MSRHFKFLCSGWVRLPPWLVRCLFALRSCAQWRDIRHGGFTSQSHGDDVLIEAAEQQHPIEVAAASSCVLSRFPPSSHQVTLGFRGRTGPWMSCKAERVAGPKPSSKGGSAELAAWFIQRQK
eukprot:1412256-Amphidinium_carterae.1